MAIVMNLFKKIYDYKKDFLQKRFVLSEKKYFYFYQGQRLTDEDLSRRSKKILKKENAQLVTNPTLLAEEIQNAKANERFLFLKSHHQDV